MSKLKTTLLLGVVSASLMMSPSFGYAANDFAGWAGVVGPAAGMVIGLLLTGIPNVMAAVNVDPAQLALEYLVYDAQQEITYEWDPEPKESYEKAAQANEDKSQYKTGSDSPEHEDLNFEVQVLTPTGIEAVGLEGTTGALASPAGRQAVMNGLTALQADDKGGIFIKSDARIEEIELLNLTQQQNEQWLSTAGIARSELGLLAAQQAAVDDGMSESDIISPTTNGRNDMGGTSNKEAASSEEKSWIYHDKEIKTLAGLAGSGTSTGSAMRIQALMNLELAQRINLADTLQGGALSLSAARLLHMSNPNN